MLAALALSASILLLVPSFFYQTQADSIDLPFGNFLLIGTVAFLVIALILAAIAVVLRKQIDFSRLYVALAVAVTVKALFLASYVPMLDGDAAFAPLFSSHGLWSAVTLLIAVGLGLTAVYLMKLGAGPALAAVLMFSLQPLLDAKNRTFSTSSLSFEKTGQPTPLLELSKSSRNVLIVLIDTFSSDVFAEIVERSEVFRPELSGFTYFYNTISYAPYTMMSMQNVYSGRTYSGGDVVDIYGSMREDSLFTDFEESGGSTALGGFFFYKQCPAQQCWSEVQILGTRPIEASVLSYLELLDNGLLRVVPTSLQRWIYNAGDGHLRGYLDPSLQDRGHLSDRVIRDFARNLRAVDSAPALKFLHLMTTHSPLVLDERCRKVRQMSHARDNYKKQAACAISGFVALLKALKAARVYDNTTIVLLGDHGASVAGRVPDRRFFGVVQPVVGRVGRFKPVLAIKPAEAREPFALSGVPAQLGDLRRTLCAISDDGCQGDVPGEDLFSLAPGVDRRREFVDYDNSVGLRQARKSGTISEELLTRYTIGGTLDSLLEIYARQR